MQSQTGFVEHLTNELRSAYQQQGIIVCTKRAYLIRIEQIMTDTYYTQGY